MDPITTTVAVSAATHIVTDAVRKDAVEFLQKVFRKGWNLASGLFSEQVNDWRRDNALITLGLAHQRLRDIGVQPAEVAPQIILPLLEAASLQDSEYLRNAWANLLANAACPREQAVRPRFVEILRGLTAGEARFLDAVCSPHPVLGRSFAVEQLSHAAADAGIALWKRGVGSHGGYPSHRDWESGSATIAVALDNFCALGLMQRKASLRPIELSNIATRGHGGRIQRSASRIEPKIEEELCLTQLGAEFIIACRAPYKP